MVGAVAHGAVDDGHAEALPLVAVLAHTVELAQGDALWEDAHVQAHHGFGSEAIRPSVSRSVSVCFTAFKLLFPQASLCANCVL